MRSAPCASGKMIILVLRSLIYRQVPITALPFVRRGPTSQYSVHAAQVWLKMSCPQISAQSMCMWQGPLALIQTLGVIYELEWLT